MTTDTFISYSKEYDLVKSVESLINYFWDLSDFPDNLLLVKLKLNADTDFDDDYSEFLKNQNLLKAGLDIIGVRSFEKIQKIIIDTKDLSDRIVKVSKHIRIPSDSYMKEINRKFIDDFKNEQYFVFMLAEVAILLILSKKFLKDWCKSFGVIADNHPAPLDSIKNVLSIAMRGEALITESHSVTHRSFDNSKKILIALIEDEGERGHIWIKKRMRIVDALGGDL